MTRRKSSSGYLGLFMVSVAQRLASFWMRLDVVGGGGLAFHDPFEGGFAVDDVGVGSFGDVADRKMGGLNFILLGAT